MEFFIATKNPGKINEFKRIFDELNLSFVTEKDFTAKMPEPEETGNTFAENALIKARAGAVFSGLPTIADDSGLCVDAIGGKPGILSARYAGNHGDSKANNIKLLNDLKGVPKAKRTARFVCVIACVFPSGEEFTVTGECEGLIDFAESGNGGFGYDPLFISSLGKFSEIDAYKKDKISHRGNALRAFKVKISKYV